MTIQITISETRSIQYGFYPVCSFEGNIDKITNRFLYMNSIDFGDITIPLVDIETIVKL
jgi:hypothetical protein